jgi:hypothetical protein
MVDGVDIMSIKLNSFLFHNKVDIFFNNAEVSYQPNPNSWRGTSEVLCHMLVMEKIYGDVLREQNKEKK